MKKKRTSGAGRRQPGIGSKLLLGIVTCVNLALSIVLTLLRRQDTLRALREDDRVKVLLETRDQQK